MISVQALLPAKSDSIASALVGPALALLAVYIGYSFIKKVYSVYFGPLSKYPGPKLMAWSSLPWYFVSVRGKEHTVGRELHDKYGPIVRIGPIDISYSNGASSWKDIYGFQKSGPLKAFRDPRVYRHPLNGVPDIFSADDAGHSRIRRNLSHSFSEKSIRELEPSLKYWSAKLLLKLQDFAKSGKTADMVKCLNCATFDIMADLCFSESLGMLDDGEYLPWVANIFAQTREAHFVARTMGLSPLLDKIGSALITSNPMLRPQRLTHWNFTKNRLDKRLSRTPERSDLWTKVQQGALTSKGLSLEEQYGAASIFMIAGTETTASALSGLFHLLGHHPDVMNKIRKEMRSNFDSFDEISIAKAAALPYLHAVLQESLRMYPPLPIAMPRVVGENGAEIEGHYLPKGTRVGAHATATYRSALHWKNPDEFHPERWLGDPEYKDDHLDSLEPFSIGPKNCIGKNLAWHEMRLLTASILVHYDVKLCDKSEDWSDQNTYILWEKKPLYCKFELVKELSPEWVKTVQQQRR